MKVEINNENKAKFFAMYLNQKVLSDNLREGERLDKSWNWSHPDFWLTLKPLSQISDEDAIEVGIMTGCWSRREVEECGDEIKDSLIDYGILFCSGVGKEWGLRMSSPFAGNLQDIIDAIDFLRSRGYALPWMGLSVDELIKAGWIRLV